MKDRITPIAVLIVLLLLLCGYVGSYYSLVLVGPLDGDNIPANRQYMDHVANYRSGGRAADIAFWPMNWMDRKLRPTTWRRE